MTLRPAAAVLAVVLALLAGGMPAGATSLDLKTELSNYAVTFERQAQYDTLGYQARMTAVGFQNGAHALAAQLADPRRNFADDLCWSGFYACAGDVRLYDW